VLTAQLSATTLNANTGAAFQDILNDDGSVKTSAAAQLAAQRAAIAAGTFRFSLRENLLDLGVRSEAAKRETYRIVGGLRGTFNDDWKYELSVNYGEFQERTKVLGNLNVQRFLLGMDAQRNGAGQIVCGSQLDPTRAGGDAAGNPAVLAADIAACQPVNPFGYGNISQAAKNYILQDTTSVGKITQFDVSGYVSGNSGKFFNLPGGPVAFSLGGEYRRETNQFHEDPLVSSGYTFYNAIADFNPPAFEVKEAFGELRVPLLKDFTLVKELTLSGAFRVSDYKGGAGTVWAYNGGVDYSPFDGLRFRANYSRSVRAPNLTELYSPQSQNFAPLFTDPCAARQIGEGSENRAKNCAAAGIPTSYDYIYQQSLQIVSGGNPDLQAEKSDSYTYGVVIQPKQVPGLSISVDYYNIKVNNVIASVDAQTIVDQCYDSPSLSNPFCGSFQRVAAGATGPNGEEAYRIIEGSLLASPLNYASLKARGLNTEIAYTHRIGANSSISAKLNWNHQFENTQFTDPTDPTFGNTILGEVGSPKDQFNINLDAKINQFFVSYQIRYLSKQLISGLEYEDVNSFEGRPPQNQDYADIEYYPDVFYNDIRVGVDLDKGSTFYVGIDNLTNRLPPLYSTGIGDGTAIFDNVGRRFYAGFTAKF
jgi:outer membrane receptor protein involved in Fe transport